MACRVQYKTFPQQFNVFIKPVQDYSLYTHVLIDSHPHKNKETFQTGAVPYIYTTIQWNQKCPLRTVKPLIGFDNQFQQTLYMI